MNIFPEDISELDFDIKRVIKEDELPIFKEYAIDLKTGELLYNEQGQNIILEKNEALKIWIWSTLRTTRNKYKIYSNNYGNDFENLFGQEYSKELINTEAERYLQECLLANPYIKEINDINIEFEGSKLTIYTKINTIYGEVEANV